MYTAAPPATGSVAYPVPPSYSPNDFLIKFPYFHLFYFIIYPSSQQFSVLLDAHFHRQTYGIANLFSSNTSPIKRFWIFKEFQILHYKAYICQWRLLTNRDCWLIVPVLSSCSTTPSKSRGEFSNAHGHVKWCLDNKHQYNFTEQTRLQVKKKKTNNKQKTKTNRKYLKNTWNFSYNHFQSKWYY